MLTVCYFGNYKPSYSRNRVLIKGLIKNQVRVIECNDRSKFLVKYFKLAVKYWKVRKECDIIVIGFLGVLAIILARLLTRKPIIYDAFVSIYESNVSVRKIYSPASWQAKGYWFLDWLACRLANVVLTDTLAHKNFFKDIFKVPPEKIYVIFVGSDDEVIYPSEKSEGDNGQPFLVHFHGSFISLQGIEYIVGAAKLIEKENIMFNLIGRGQTYEEIRGLASNLGNVKFINPVTYDKLRDYIIVAGVCLGVFGLPEEAKRVIPNKAFEALAAGCPLITGDSPAVRELLVDRQNVLFCKLADANDLAKKIMELKNNPALRRKIAANGYQLFQSKLTPVILGKQLVNIIKNHVS